MRVLLTGQVGLEKGSYLKAAQGLARDKGKQIDYVTLGEKMIESYEGKIDDRTILNLPNVVLDLLRRYAWREIVHDVKLKNANDIFIINSHAVFRWHHGFFPAIDLDLVNDLEPDFMVTLIDDVDKIKDRLIERSTDYFELWELLAWREEEIWLTKLLRDSLKKLTGKEIGYFILPKTQGPNLLVRILTEPKTPKIYMSFAVTGLPEEKRKEVEEFKKEVSTKFIGFDPLAMGERSIVITAESLAKELGDEFSRVGDLLAEVSKAAQEKKRRWTPRWDRLSALALAEQPTRLRILWGESPLPSIARFGRLAYPTHGEVTNHGMLGCKRHDCHPPGGSVGATWVASKPGGLNIKE